MKFSNLFVFIAIFITISSCKKDRLIKETNQVDRFKQQIETYLNNLLPRLPTDKMARIEMLKKSVDYSSTQIFPSVNGYLVVTTLTDYMFNRAKRGSDTAILVSTPSTVTTKLVCELNHDLKINTAYLTQISGNQTLESIENDIVNILLSKTKYFSGSISVNTLTNDLRFQARFEQGELKEISSAKTKGKARLGDNKLNGGQKTQSEAGCTDWYWVTTYHFADGSSISSEIYLYSTCNESIAPNIEQGNLVKEPCDKIKPLKNDTALISKLKDLKNTTSLFSETGYAIRKGTIPSTFQELPAVPGSVNQIVIPFSSLTTNIDGLLHSHTTNGYSIFSAADIQSIGLIYDSAKMNNLLDYSISVVTASQTAYTLTVSDATLFNSFKNTYLTSTVGLGLLESMYSIYSISSTATSANNEKNFLQLLKTLNSGLQLTSMDFTNFTSWTVKTLDNNNNIKSIPCND